MESILSGIKNIIFDFGGVILNLDFDKSFKAFEKLGIENFNEMYSMAIQSELFNELEVGKINANEFIELIKTQLPSTTSDQHIIDAWNAMLLDIPTERIDLLLQLKNRYRTFLLSNTNIIHYEKYAAELKSNYGYESFDPLFEKAYFSHNMGLKKPGREIYDFVIEQHQLNPSETLFIDDTAKNMVGAEASGLRTYLLPPNQDIIELFEGTP